MNTRSKFPYSADASLCRRIIQHHDEAAPTSKLRYSEAYQRFLLQLYFPSRIDSSGRIAIPRELLAECEGIPEQQVRSNNYCARDFLVRFRDDVMPSFEWERHHQGKHARTVRRMDLNPELQARALFDDPMKAENRVFVHTDERWTEAKAREFREASRKRANRTANNSLWSDQIELLEYMNGLPFHAFAAAVRRHGHEAREVAECSISDEVKLHSCLATLRAVQEQPQPFLQVSKRGRSPRVFPSSLGIYSLSKKVRSTIVQDFMQVDLVNAQTAINARLWKVDPVVDFLADPTNNWWSSLVLHVTDGADGYRKGTDEYERVKRVLKRACYSVQFGMEIPSVKRNVTRGLADKQAARRLFEHPLFHAMVMAREQRLKEIKSRGGIVDAYGNSFSLSDAPSIRSLMATEAQTWEMRLMRPVLDVALKHPCDLRLMLWLHDGAAINFLKGGAHEAARRRELVRAVEERANSFGIPTRLEIEEPCLTRAKRQYGAERAFLEQNGAALPARARLKNSPIWP